MIGAIKLGSILGITIGATIGLMHPMPAGTPVVHLAPQLSPRVQVGVQVASSPTPTKPEISYIRPVSAKKSPKTPKVTPEIRTTPSPTPEGIGMWTPYNGHCVADCFPDLTPEAMTAVNEYFKGSLEAPGPNGPEFKGLTGTRLDHYICEYAHVLGDQWAMDGCKGVD